MPRTGRRALLILLVIAAQGAAIAQQQTAPAPRITVTGEVKQPGSFDWTPGLTAGQAVALAGGLTDRALPTWWVHRVENQRGVGTSVAPDTVLRAGDTLNIMRRSYAAAGPRVNVFGAVKTPGEYTLTSSRNPVASAIAAAGGFADDAGHDVQLWQWRDTRGSGQIDVNTNHADLLIFHIGRRDIEQPTTNYVPAPRDDNAAIWLAPASAEAATRAASVSVTGEVRQPGTVQLNPATLRSALVAVGGPTSRAGTLVNIDRGNCRDRVSVSGGYETALYNDIASGALDVPLCDGDTVTLPRSINSRQSIRYQIGPLMSGAPYSWSMPSGGTPWSPGLTLDNAIANIRQEDAHMSALASTIVRVLRHTDHGFAFLNGANLALELKDEILISPVVPAIDVSGTWRLALPDDAAARLDLQVTGTNVTGTLTTHGVPRSLTGELLGGELLLSASSSGNSWAFVALVPGPRVLYGTLDTFIATTGLSYREEIHWEASRAGHR